MMQLIIMFQLLGCGALALISSSTRGAHYRVSAPTKRFLTEISYEEPVFRPPAEWRSLILQVTIGCSWNKCTFCEMYQTKQFRIKPLEDVDAELTSIVDSGQASFVKDIFLADGDAMMLPTPHLLQLLKLIQGRLPRVRRISSYCLPRNLRHKSVEDLTQLREAGLKLVYVGCESGNDEVLGRIQKGETCETSLEALTKLRDAGIKRSIMILLGLGGTALSSQHAVDSAQLCNIAIPEYLSVLTTSFPRGLDRIQEGFDGEFQPLTARESLQELRQFLEAINMFDTNKTIFRSDHASNYLVLKGRLGRERDRLLKEVTDILDAPEEDDVYKLRPEWARGL